MRTTKLFALGRSTCLTMLLTGAAPGVPRAQQVVDSTFIAPALAASRFSSGTGPVVLVDEAHRNFHTAAGRYAPFAKVLARDGFVVRGVQRLDGAALMRAHVFVIANAIDSVHQHPQDWRLPARDAFTDDEIDAVVSWVRGGGALMLIADHMPFPGAVRRLARALGITFVNGFVTTEVGPDQRTGDYPITFRRADSTLRPHAITAGWGVGAGIDSIVTFTGSAFFLSSEAATDAALLRLPPRTRVLMPARAWQFTDSTPSFDAEGLLQGAAFPLGRGRVAVFAEAAMFTAQLKGPTRVPMGLNAPQASQNAQLLVNTMRWLARVP